MRTLQGKAANQGSRARDSRHERGNCNASDSRAQSVEVSPFFERGDLLGGEDDPIGDLTALRGQIVRALTQLDTTVQQLKKGRAEMRRALPSGYHNALIASSSAATVC